MTPLPADVFSGAYCLIDCGPPLFCICPGIPLSLFLRGLSIRFLGVTEPVGQRVPKIAVKTRQGWGRASPVT